MEDKGIMGRRVQYARNYLELFDLFERNGIDVWEVEDDIDRAIYVAGIEHPGYEHGVTARKLVRAIRHADMSGQNRAAAVRELERERCLDADEPLPEALKTEADKGQETIEAFVQRRLRFLAERGHVEIWPADISEASIFGLYFRRNEIRQELERLEVEGGEFTVRSRDAGRWLILRPAEGFVASEHVTSGN